MANIKTFGYDGELDKAINIEDMFDKYDFEGRFVSNGGGFFDGDFNLSIEIPMIFDSEDEYYGVENVDLSLTSHGKELIEKSIPIKEILHSERLIGDKGKFYFVSPNSFPVENRSINSNRPVVIYGDISLTAAIYEFINHVKKEQENFQIQELSDTAVVLEFLSNECKKALLELQDN
jgi:hypothetical protein